ncbi:hypothetical protein G1C97_0420 [Bifidobacterium sp. DSM 109959]|uniref:CTP synthase n=1 Tax=Bifidobacterium olomucense TaxID=2675324 RepID=A0A7Y0HVR2_9BIFI|nr:hypothetical protein [Bifidobacterium sp. DSM 109959]
MRAAEHERRCAIGDGKALSDALRRRVQAGEIVSPYPNLFASALYWASLNAEERSLHSIRALSKLHPKWVFAGLSAACVYGYEHSYMLHDGTVHIACTGGITKRDSKRLHRVYMSSIPRWRSGDILITSPARTLIDCAALPFDRALAVYDSALRYGHVSKTDVSTLMIQTNCDDQAVKKLLVHANSMRENGGESWAYAHIIELGYAEPLFQITFDNPNNYAMPYRVDFCWKLADGRIIVAEYDGVAKYADTSNPHRANLKAKIAYERRREQHLKEQGVTTVVHLFSETVDDKQLLDATLMNAGVPKIR